MSYKRYWVALAIVIIGSFAVLGGVGRKMISEAPPIPRCLHHRRAASLHRQFHHRWPGCLAVHRRTGNRHSLGSRRLCRARLERRLAAPGIGDPAEHLGCQRRGGQFRRSRSRPAGHLQGSPDSRDADQHLRCRRAIASRSSADRAAAFEQLRAYYTNVFATGRTEYAIPAGALTNAAKQHQLAAFFWWTSWACSTDRPGSETTYTNNWPHEPLIGNVPTSGAVLWSVFSFVGLLAGIGGLVWWYASQEKELVHGPYPEKRSLPRIQTNPVAACDAEILLRGGDPLGRADSDGRSDRALRRRGPGLLWISARQISALRRHAHLASANRHFLDRDVMACHRPLRWPGCQRSRAEVSSGLVSTYSSVR